MVGTMQNMASCDNDIFGLSPTITGVPSMDRSERVTELYQGALPQHTNIPSGRRCSQCQYRAMLVRLNVSLSAVSPNR
jgi:hypothetical protein